MTQQDYVRLQKMARMESGLVEEGWDRSLGIERLLKTIVSITTLIVVTCFICSHASDHEEFKRTFTDTMPI